MKGKVGFLCRVNRSGSAKGVSHVWDGHDTLCHMWSAGALRESQVGFFGSPPKKICKICKENKLFDTMQIADFRNKQTELF